MTPAVAVALILFVIAGIFFCLARWIKLSDNHEGDAGTLFFGLSLIFVLAALTTLMVGSPNLA